MSTIKSIQTDTTGVSERKKKKAEAEAKANAKLALDSKRAKRKGGKKAAKAEAKAKARAKAMAKAEANGEIHFKPNGHQNISKQLARFLRGWSANSDSDFEGFLDLAFYPLDKLIEKLGFSEKEVHDMMEAEKFEKSRFEIKEIDDRRCIRAIDNWSQPLFKFLKENGRLISDIGVPVEPGTEICHVSDALKEIAKDNYTLRPGHEIPKQKNRVVVSFALIGDIDRLCRTSKKSPYIFHARAVEGCMQAPNGVIMSLTPVKCFKVTHRETNDIIWTSDSGEASSSGGVGEASSSGV